MKNRGQRQRWEYSCVILPFAVALCFMERASAQIRYSVPEELKHGAVVGNIAKDLGLDTSTLTDRRFRVVSGSKEPLFQVNENNGVLYVNKNIDREELCENNIACLINLKTVVENPLEIHYVGVEIVDINDHSPSFPEGEKRLEIAESTVPGARFQLQAARDPDLGVNSVRFYKLTQNEHFELEIRDRGEDNKIPFLVLKKPLDREHKTVHKLLLTASDGGNPPRSGTLNITVTVLDNNDNRPLFEEEVYSVTLRENIPIGTVVIRVKATDVDDGTNGDVVYAFGTNLKSKVYELFDLDVNTGEIKVKGQIDFEESDIHQIDIQASDKGQPPMSVDCSVIIKIEDVNDNTPEIDVTSLSNVISEDSKPGTLISLVSVSDRDSGVNGQVVCSVSEELPFELKSSVQDNLYSLVTKVRLDRESVSQYSITIIAKDCGDPSLSSFKTVSVQISDVNDNAPVFSENPYMLYLVENNSPGSSIFSVSASDRDLNENAEVSYYILKGDVTGSDLSSFININPENGNIYALKSFDFEAQKNFLFQITAKDAGVPSLSTNVTVNVFILDQNDNAPVILSPLSSNGSAEAVVEIARNVNAGYLVTKVRAYDADIGYNAWLSFSLLQITDPSLFSLERYTGEIRTLRPFTESDDSEQKVIVQARDNGDVSLSATATIRIVIVEKTESFAVSDFKHTAKHQEDNNVTFYLIVTLGSVSFLFLMSVITLVSMQCCMRKSHAREKNDADASGNGTLCHSIHYRAGEKRYMLVDPRMSIGSTIGLGSNGNTLVVSEKRRQSSGEVRVCRRQRLIK